MKLLFKMLNLVCWCVMFLVNIDVIFAQLGQLPIYNDFVDTGVRTVADTFSWVKSNLGFGDACPFVANPVDSLNASLPKYILGQDHALTMILNAAANWEMNRGDREPLVLVFTGDTGVGKTETSFRMAQALLARKERLGSTQAYNGVGLLNLRGEMYSPSSEAGKMGPAEVHRRITAALVEHLIKCQGYGVVVFEEVQKVIDGGLQVLLPALDTRGTLTTFDASAPVGQQHKSYSTENLIFIFTTDIGGPIIRKFIFKYNGKENVPVGILRSSLIDDLSQGWGKPIIKHVKEVIPFLPLGFADMTAICRLAISTYAARLRGTHWLDLVVDNEVVQKIASSPSLFETRVAKVGEQEVSFYSSKLGARGLENGHDGPLGKLKRLIHRAAQSQWHPGQVFHVGLATPSMLQEWSIQGKDRLYFQWCYPHEIMLMPECAATMNSNELRVCTASATNKILTLSQGPPTDAKAGLIPWLAVSTAVATTRTCETILIENL